MSSSDAQTDALWAVAYQADATWANDLSAYQKANMSLYLRARHMYAISSKWSQLSPRTVRDSIPQSKLAQYANYEYNEARELSYSPMVMSFERLCDSFDPDEVKEAWMLEDVDDLLFAFLSMGGENYEACTEHEDDFPCRRAFCEKSFESPFLDARSFDQMALKLKIDSRDIKKLWDTENFPYYGWHPELKTKHLILYKSSTSQIFTSLDEKADESQWLDAWATSEGNLSQIKALTKSLKDQNTWIFKNQSTRSWLEASGSSIEVSTHRRLYSAVLQGSSPPAESVGFQVKPPTAQRSETGTETTAAFQCSTNYCQSTFSCTPPVYSNYQFLNPRLFSNHVLNFRQTSCFPLVLPNCLLGYQRGVFPSYRPMVLPSAAFFNIQHPSVKITQHPTVNLLAARPPCSTVLQQRLPHPPGRPPRPVHGTLDQSVLLDDPEPYVPVTGVSSDELEQQALEQYAASNTNVFQELERQAAEQYDTSENWNSPPKYRELTRFFRGVA